MANVWVSADFHFGHANIIADDELYVLGDFCISGPKVAATYRQKIRCKKVYFVLGNHDRAGEWVHWNNKSTSGCGAGSECSLDERCSVP